MRGMLCLLGLFMSFGQVFAINAQEPCGKAAKSACSSHGYDQCCFQEGNQCACCKGEDCCPKEVNPFKVTFEKEVEDKAPCGAAAKAACSGHGYDQCCFQEGNQCACCKGEDCCPKEVNPFKVTFEKEVEDKAPCGQAAKMACSSHGYDQCCFQEGNQCACCKGEDCCPKTMNPFKMHTFEKQVGAQEPCGSIAKQACKSHGYDQCCYQDDDQCACCAGESCCPQVSNPFKVTLKKDVEAQEPCGTAAKMACSSHGYDQCCFQEGNQCACCKGQDCCPKTNNPFKMLDIPQQIQTAIYI